MLIPVQRGLALALLAAAIAPERMAHADRLSTGAARSISAAKRLVSPQIDRSARPTREVSALDFDSIVSASGGYKELYISTKDPHQVALVFKESGVLSERMLASELHEYASLAAAGIKVPRIFGTIVHHGRPGYVAQKLEGFNVKDYALIHPDGGMSTPRSPLAPSNLFKAGRARATLRSWITYGSKMRSNLEQQLTEQGKTPDDFRLTNRNVQEFAELLDQLHTRGVSLDDFQPFVATDGVYVIDPLNVRIGEARDDLGDMLASCRGMSSIIDVFRTIAEVKGLDVTPLEKVLTLVTTTRARHD